MEARSLHYIAEAAAGELRHGCADQMVGRVCTDSRLAEPGDLFIALAGERHDAHQLLGEVARRRVGAPPGISKLRQEFVQPLLPLVLKHHFVGNLLVPHRGHKLIPRLFLRVFVAQRKH